MDRRLDNIFINEKGRGLNYTPPSSGGGTHNYPPGDSRVMVVSIGGVEKPPGFILIKL